MKSLDTLNERYPTAARILTGPVTTAARYLLAILFIFSGVAKAINPFGLSIKVGEYFAAFGLGFLDTLSAPVAILLPAVEMLIGFMLLCGISRRLAAWLVFLAMSFFTLLTLWLAVANPVNDCGCFGDLVHLSNWGTFFKNLIFWPLAALLWWNRNRQRAFNPSVGQTVSTYVITVAVSLGIPLACYNTLPPVDPTPFKIGVNIPHAMTVHQNETQTTLIYKDKQDGSLHEFSLEDTTWYDSSRWEYVDTRTVGQSTAPDIQSVPMFDGSIDRSDEILGRKGYTLLYVVNTYDPRYLPAMGELAAYIHHHSGRVVALSASELPPHELTELGIEPLSGDYTVLHTMIQHHTGGALLLHDGTIIGKWSMNRLPQWTDAAHDPLNNVLSENRLTTERQLGILFLLLVGVIAVWTIRANTATKQ